MDVRNAGKNIKKSIKTCTYKFFVISLRLVKFKFTKKMSINIKKMEDSQNIGIAYVYDISLDGSVVNALGMNVVSNTDG